MQLFVSDIKEYINDKKQDSEKKCDITDVRQITNQAEAAVSGSLIMINIVFPMAKTLTMMTRNSVQYSCPLLNPSHLVFSSTRLHVSGYENERMNWGSVNLGLHSLQLSHTVIQ